MSKQEKQAAIAMLRQRFLEGWPASATQACGLSTKDLEDFQTKHGALHDGQFQFPNENLKAIEHFLKAIERQAPQVIENLRIEVLPSHVPDNQSNAAYHKALDDWLLRWHLWHAPILSPRRRPSAFRLSGAGRRMRRFPFSSPFLQWILGVAIDTLSKWRCSNTEVAVWNLKPMIAAIPMSVDQYNEVTYTFAVPGWNPLSEDRAQVTERIKKSLDEQIAMWLDKEEKNARDHGLEAAPQKTATKEHMEWWVHFQILKQSYREIARNAGTDPQTVHAAIKNAAKLLLGDYMPNWLRKVRRGRPPKENNPPDS